MWEVWEETTFKVNLPYGHLTVLRKPQHPCPPLFALSLVFPLSVSTDNLLNRTVLGMVHNVVAWEMSDRSIYAISLNMRNPDKLKYAFSGEHNGYM